MNIKRGLERIWIVVSALWVVVVGVMVSGMDKDQMEKYIFGGVICLFVWWGILYISFWISSGFSGGEKKGETDE